MNKVVQARIIQKMALLLIPGITKTQAFEIGKRAVGK